MRILVLNWRCPKNPRAGGAEALTFEIARRLVGAGHYVEWFSSKFPGCAAEEDLDGVHLVRAGRQWSVHWRAFQRYSRSLQFEFDVLIDEVNTIPFFTPLWARRPTFMLMFQLAREVWWYETAFPLSLVGYALEPLYLRLYRSTPVLTISESTAADLRSLGYRGPIAVLPVGVEPVVQPPYQKAAQPTFIYVGRLTPSKRVADIVKAFAIFRRLGGPADLWLVGDGPARYSRRLRVLAERLGIAPSVRFWGRLSDPVKHQKMAEAHALLMASVREGWGLVVNEANACGTPAVVYDVPGLRDAVQHRKTGLVVAPSPDQLAAGMLELLANRKLLDRLGEQAARRASGLSYDLTTAAFRSALGGAVVP